MWEDWTMRAGKVWGRRLRDVFICPILGVVFSERSRFGFAKRVMVIDS
jgi:hypothetical protein